ncbi:uncharacterized protein dap [Chelonus insularis]|uniref:uncharacterized protein dap n=1 Tax=Chelonus insularis TaxID=460826 RepID=UPI00158D828E|nr:uncharacterized protein LOC118075073 [Chelonus insularis]
MSARVMNPAMMTESRNLGGGGRVAPSRAALARVRRDLFGPVDRVAARALVERELEVQSRLDAERWGFDFHREIPKENSRYDWEIVAPAEVVPEPYALRGMPYLRKNSPPTPRKQSEPTSSFVSSRRSMSVSPMNTDVIEVGKAERTPPQDPRVPDIGESDEHFVDESCRHKHCLMEDPTTPILPVTARNQSRITDYMKSRKRTISNASTKKIIVEPPEKISRNAGQIRS